jgi:hypothetical protein
VEFTAFQEHKRHSFDAFCKKVLKYKARDIYRERAKQAQREINFSEIPDAELAELSCKDEYFTNAHQFKVLDFDISIQDELIAEALMKRSGRRSWNRRKLSRNR